MEHTNTIVAKAQGAKATATKYYWVNRYNVRLNELSTSTPFDTKEDAIRHIENFIEFYDKAIASDSPTLKPFEKVGENKWQSGNFVVALEDKGDMLLHLKDIWEMQGIATALELGATEDDVINVKPSRNLLGVMYFVHELHSEKTLAEKDDIIRDICNRYYTDAEVQEVFDRRANALAKAKSAYEILSAILAD